MKTIHKKDMDYDWCLKKIIIDRHNGKLRYFSSVAVHKEDYRKYMRWLKKCEKLGLDFFLGYTETETEYTVLWGFSSFEMPDIGKSIAVSYCFEENVGTIIAESAKVKYVNSKGFILAEPSDMPRVIREEKYWGRVIDIINKY